VEGSGVCGGGGLPEELSVKIRLPRRKLPLPAPELDVVIVIELMRAPPASDTPMNNGALLVEVVLSVHAVVKLAHPVPPFTLIEAVKRLLV
jgi:hypothetical protein